MLKAATLALIGVVACMPVTTTAVQSRPIPPVEVAVPAPPSEAFDVVRAAFVAEGLTIDQADRSAGMVKSVGVTGDIVSVGGLFPVTARPEHFYRATILPTPEGSRVLLIVTGRSHMISRGTEETSEEFELSECPEGGGSAGAACRAQLAKVQERIAALAAEIRAQAANVP